MQDEFKFKGKSIEELKTLSIEEFMKLVPARSRRTLQRGALERYKPFLEKVKKAQAGQIKKPIKTQFRDMVVLPDMIGLTIQIHNGKSFNAVTIQPEMVGHIIGEFSLTRNRVAHSAPGVGATKSSTAAASKAK